MGSMSIWHWLIVALVVLLLFGKGRISDIMGETAKGIKAFKKGMADDDRPAQVTNSPVTSADATARAEEANRS
jgi:sec-independent protein translocase protein TatA